jgi:beta-glucosidase
VCIHRHPLGGRNFESYSEDPLLTGKLASSMIQGVQDLGVAATIKHFVANEQETDRMFVDEKIGERALREIYLRPFEIAVKEARPWALMSAYNKVNGEHCDVNEWLLSKVLRQEWGWDGLVMSDWGGTNSLAGVRAGLELEMPGPPRVRKLDAVMEGVKRGEVREKDIDERVRTLLRFLVRLKAFENPDGPMPEKVIDRPEHRKLIRDAGARGIVMLKNDNQILPLSLEKIKGKKVALIGFGKDALAHGGGSAAVNAHYKITPWDAFQNACGGDVELVYAKGARRERLLDPLGKNDRRGTITGLDGQPGFSLSFYDPSHPTSPTAVMHGYEKSAYSPMGSQKSLWKILELVGDFTPAETGNHCLAGSGIGRTEVFIDEEVVIQQEKNFSDPMGVLFNTQTETEMRHTFAAGKTYRVRIRSYPPRNLGLGILEGRAGFRMGFSLASDADADLQGEAVELAREADYVVVFTGHDPQWETEGRDQDSFHLPRYGSQDALVSAVAAANSNTVVVNSTGVAVAMPWLDQVAGLLQTWFPGQESGNSIVDVLTGSVNPEGHLPTTFPSRIEDAAAYGNFPGTYDGEQLTVVYAEGVFVGYRHYDRLSKDKVNFPFGFGLSYTSFRLGEMRVSGESKDTFTVSYQVSNTGQTAGGIAVQLYAGRTQPHAEHPAKCLVAFQKVRLLAGATQTGVMLFKAKDFAYFDEARYAWIVEAGQYDISLGRSAADIAQVVSIEVGQEVVYAP